MENKNEETRQRTCPVCGGGVEIHFHRFGFSETRYQDTEKCGIRCSGCETIFFIDTIEIRYEKGNATAKWDLIESYLWDRFDKINYSPSILKENQELKAEIEDLKLQSSIRLATIKGAQSLNAELLEVLEEAVFMIQGYQVQHGEGPSNKKKLESLKSAITKAKGQ